MPPHQNIAVPHCNTNSLSLSLSHTHTHTHTHRDYALEQCKEKGRSQTIIPWSSEAYQHPGRHLWESHFFTTAHCSPSSQSYFKIYGAALVGSLMHWWNDEKPCRKSSCWTNLISSLHATLCDMDLINLGKTSSLICADCTMTTPDNRSPRRTSMCKNKKCNHLFIFLLILLNIYGNVWKLTQLRSPLRAGKIV